MKAEYRVYDDKQTGSQEMYIQYIQEGHEGESNGLESIEYLTARLVTK